MGLSHAIRPGRGQDADVGEPGLQPRTGVGEQVGGEADLGPLAEGARELAYDRLGVVTCRKQSRAEPAGRAQVLGSGGQSASR